MTAKELSAYIGQRFWFRLGRIRIIVRVVDARVVYGKLQARITPDSNPSADNETWVEMSSLVGYQS